MDVGAPTTPASNGGSGASAGAIISSQPGSKVGLPSTGEKGKLAMSPSGGDKPGLGDNGGGKGIVHGSGPGSGLNGENSGAGKNGSGPGSDPNAHGGISPNAGAGGAGSAPAGNPAAVGVSIEGGTTSVTLPSFGSDAGSGDPSTPGRSSTAKHSSTLGVTIVATATSGGAFEPYKSLLHGEKYTTYFDTSMGTLAMEFADGSTSASGAIGAPVAIHTDLPDRLPHVRIVITGILDSSGNLRSLRVLEAGPADATAKVMTALHSWKFQPAVRGDRPVGVTAILGFNINTDDRF
jgi:hypothetical protein